MRGNNLSYEIFREVNCGVLSFYETGLGVAFGLCSDLPWTWTTSFLSTYLSQPVGFFIMYVWVAARILSSSVEYLFARLYNSSIIAGRSRDSEWKKGVDDSKLLLKF